MMQSSPIPTDSNRPFLTWQRITDWAQEHYRCRSFSKDERIPARPGLLYLVQRGTVRLVGSAELKYAESKPKSRPRNRKLDQAFLGFVGAGQPFELIAQSPFSLQACARS